MRVSVARPGPRAPIDGGAVVDLGLVGDPVEADPALLELLLGHGYVPVVASIGLENGNGAAPAILNVNADVMACRIAAALGECDLVIAGATPGVLDTAGGSIALLDIEGIDEAIASGTATAGMVAKLTACRTALARASRACASSTAVASMPAASERRTGDKARGGASGVRAKQLEWMQDMTTTPMDVKALESRHVLQNYRRFPVVFERGDGMRLFDDAASRISTSCRASAWRRSGTRIRRSRAPWRSKRRRWSTRRTCTFIRCRASWPTGCRR